MGQTNNLRLKEVRAVFRLVGECRELSIDSTLWRRHMLTELVRLTGGKVAMGGPAAVRNGLLEPDPPPAVDLGWEGAPERAIFAQFLRDDMHRKDPALTAFGPLLGTLHSPLSSLTRSRRQLIDDTTWYRSAAYCDYHRPSGTDDGMMSVVSLGDGRVHGIALFRPPNERPFDTRHRKLLHVFHHELAPHLFKDLAPPGNDPITSLSPRLRKVLVCLLEGDSEPQAAARLGLTRDTTHQYVKALFRHFNVNSRSQLLARFVRVPRHLLTPS